MKITEQILNTCQGEKKEDRKENNKEIMDKNQLLEKVKSGNYNKEQLVGWITALPNTSLKTKPNTYKVGDVFTHVVFKHPYILLERRKEDWVCGLLTSEENCPEILEKCNSRFFAESYITKALFTVSQVEGSFMGIYDNNKHLKEILSKLKKNLISL